MNSSNLRAAVIGAAIAVIAFYAGMTVNGDDPAATPTMSAVATASPTSSPTPTTPSLVELDYDERGVENIRGAVQGERLRLIVLETDDIEKCTPLGRDGSYPAAYKCTGVAGNRFEPIFMRVIMMNTSSTALTVSLDRFVLAIAGAQSPIDVRSDADAPESFIQPRQLVPPGESVSGYLVFDGQSFGDLSAETVASYIASLSYVDGDQTLRVNFDY